MKLVEEFYATCDRIVFLGCCMNEAKVNHTDTSHEMKSSWCVGMAVYIQ